VGSFKSPVDAVAAPGDRSHLFVVEQAGRIMLLSGGRKLSRPFLDIRSSVRAGGEQGFLSLVFAPDYQSSGLFFVYFTGRNGDVHVQQFRRSANPELADVRSRREVLRVAHSQFPNHNGGDLHFGPDGKLYIGIGDGGSENDPFRRGQNLGTLLAKLLRIDPRPGGGYTVPSDNPFTHRAGARPEIWAYGLRNPFRFSFDRETGDLTVADVGQNKYEEVDFRKKGEGRGANYGWSVFEGFSRFRPGNAPGYVKPVLVTKHSAGNCAIIGGYVVRDHSVPALLGRYLYGDNCNPTIYSVVLGDGRATGNRATGLKVSALSSFGEDAAGHVYLTSLGGSVYRIAPG
jgi:glucose/arabinose dehydrogenase